MSDDELVGTTLRPGLHLAAKLAHGSFGTVYRGSQEAIGRDVAVKVLHPWFALDDEPGRLFRDEIRAIGAIDHPNVVRVFDADVTADGRVYFVMELLRGVTMSELADGGPLAPVRAVALVGSLLDGLAAVHAAGHIHADVKPSNVVVVAGPGAERVVLIDFGLARLLSPGVHVEAAGGTRAYMAPEQLRDWQIDARSDVFASALVLLRLLTGWQRGEGGAVIPTLEQVGDPALRLALERALAEVPAQRPSAADFARALRGGTAEEPATPSPPPPFRQLAPMTERDRGRFHGRGGEVVRIARSLASDRPVILTAPSGTGKTSLLRAGLVPYLDAAGIDHLYVVGHADAPLDLGRVQAAAPGRRLVVIVDQIENLLVGEVGRFDELERLLDADARPPGHELDVLLSVREDFVARLLAVTPELARGVPQVRLAPLTREGARQALVDPLAEHGITIDPALHGRLLDDLERAGRALGADHGWNAGEVVYPPHLQLAGTALFAELGPGESVLTEAHYARLGGFDAIVGEYLERILAELTGDDRGVARDLFLALVASAQTRAVRGEDELLTLLGGRRAERDIRRVLAWLEERRLLARRLGADGAPRWELIHDSLVQRIEAWLTVQDLDRRRAAEVVRFHLRESRPGMPSLMSARQLRLLDSFPGLVDELESEWTRRPGSPWTPARLVERSTAVLRYRRGLTAAVGIAVLAVVGLLADRWLDERDARQRELSLRGRDLGRFHLTLAPFTWTRDPTTGAVTVRSVDATALPGLRWSLHEPSDDDGDLPGAAVEPLRFNHGRVEVRGGVLREVGVDARGGDAVLVIAGRGEGGTDCPPSVIPVRRLPGYSQREHPADIRIAVPTCTASRFDMIDVPAGPFVAGGLGDPPPPGYVAEDFPPRDPARHVDAYAIDRTEVTNAAYQVFADMATVTGFAVGIYPDNLAFASGPTYPRTDINAADAAAYCRFLGKELPTSDQWQKALRGGPTLPDGRANPRAERNLPWGAAITPVPTKLADTGRGGPVPVGSYPLDVSPLGVVDLAGNVQEWTRTPAPLPSGAIAPPSWLHPRITRGGNWNDTTGETLLIYLASENERSPRQVNYFQGARCVLVAP